MECEKLFEESQARQQPQLGIRPRAPLEERKCVQRWLFCTSMQSEIADKDSTLSSKLGPVPVLPITVPVSHQSRYILRHLLLQVRKYNSVRYETIFSEHRGSQIEDWIFKFAEGDTQDIFERNDYELKDLLKIKGNTSYDGPGIYMHIIWDRENHDRYYLYIGQSLNIQERIGRYNDPWYRKKHPCLHYYVLDSLSMESQFVLLLKIDRNHSLSGLLLNILEMWCCLLFQTLPKVCLTRYLPPDIEIRCPGIHSNVATPLQQRIYDGQDKGESVRKSFADLYRSADPLIQQYYRSLRRSFYDLANSDDPILREYFSSIFRKNQLAGAASKRENARKKSLAWL